MIDDPVADDVDDLALLLQPTAHPDHRGRHDLAPEDVEAMPLAIPVSSSIVTKSTPFADPGRCRTRMTSATSILRPSRIDARSAQRKIPIVPTFSRRKLSGRSDTRRGGNECVRTCRNRGSPYH